MERKCRILVIDDDETILSTFSARLKQEGYKVDVAATGKEAIEKSKADIYNVVLVDIKLPDMDGTKVLTELKETTPRMRKIIVTGYPNLPNAIASVNQGADHYMTKPVDMDELLRVVSDQLRKQQEETDYGQKKVSEFIETRLRDSPL